MVAIWGVLSILAASRARAGAGAVLEEEPLTGGCPWGDGACEASEASDLASQMQLRHGRDGGRDGGAAGQAPGPATAAEEDVPISSPLTRRWSSIPPRNVRPDKSGASGGKFTVHEQFYDDQLVDHAFPCKRDCRTAGKNGNNKWSQRYYLDNLYWDGDDQPIFIAIGGEGEISANYLAPYHFQTALAKKFGALLAAVEHRYYSHHSMPVADMLVHNMKYLTSEQALADLARFIDFIKSAAATSARHSGYSAKNSKVVVFGGSYPGNLAAWARQKYPGKIAGAIASSAPVFPQWNFGPIFSQVIVTILDRPGAGGGSECRDSVKLAVDELVKRGKRENWLRGKGMPTGLDMCVDGLGLHGPTPQNFAVYADTLSNQLQTKLGLSQYFSLGWLVEHNAKVTRRFCNKIAGKTGTSALKILVETLDFDPESCISTNPMIQAMEWGGDHDQGRAWSWQVCTEFGYFFPSSNVRKGAPATYLFSAFDSLVGPNLDYLTFTRGIPREDCEMTFGTDFYSWHNYYRTWKGQWVTSATYRGRNLPFQSKTTFVNGNIDPWHSLGVLPKSAPLFELCITMDGLYTTHGDGRCPFNANQRTSSDVVLIDGGSHCSDMYTGDDNAFNRTSLQIAHATITRNVARYIS